MTELPLIYITGVQMTASGSGGKSWCQCASAKLHVWIECKHISGCCFYRECEERSLPPWRPVCVTHTWGGLKRWQTARGVVLVKLSVRCLLWSADFSGNPGCFYCENQLRWYECRGHSSSWKLSGEKLCGHGTFVPFLMGNVGLTVMDCSWLRMSSMFTEADK